MVLRMFRTVRHYPTGRYALFWSPKTIREHRTITLGKARASTAIQTLENTYQVHDEPTLLRAQSAPKKCP